MTPARNKRARAGFTLIELIIALGVGSFVIIMAYAIGLQTTYEFHRQESLSRVQMSLRVATNLLRRDISRAGFLSTPNAASPGQTCGAVPASWTAGTNGTVSAFSRFDNDIAIGTSNGNAALAPTGTGNDATKFTSDSIVLLGNYETSSEYPGLTVLSSNQVAISQDWHSFRRDFTNWYQPAAGTPTYQSALGQSAFVPGRMIRIQTTRRIKHFALITSITEPTTATQPLTITFSPALPATCMADAEGGWVAPLSAIELRVLDRAGSTSATLGPSAQLMRREVQPDAKDNLLDIVPSGATPTYNSRSLLNYVVAFHLRFTMTAATAAGAADAYDPGTLTQDPVEVNGAPERIRSVQFELAARVPLPNRNLAWDATTCADHYRCFRVFTLGKAQVSSVRWTRTDVFVPNVAYEGY